MCTTCVATGAAYVVPALAGLKLYGRRRRRLAPEVAVGVEHHGVAATRAAVPVVASGDGRE